LGYAFDVQRDHRATGAAGKSLIMAPLIGILLLLSELFYCWRLVDIPRAEILGIGRKSKEIAKA
jgi:hypothetical protein